MDKPYYNITKIDKWKIKFFYNPKINKVAIFYYLNGKTNKFMRLRATPEDFTEHETDELVRQGTNLLANLMTDNIDKLCKPVSFLSIPRVAHKKELSAMMKFNKWPEEIINKQINGH
jgi:hypothetical protein